MQDRRRSPRLRSFLGGQITFSRNSSVMDCLVRNLSPEGARLAFSGTIAVPDAFSLFITQRQLLVRARMVWRRADEIGVRFVAPQPEETVIPFEAAQRIRRLEAERATLQARIGQLTQE